MTAITALVTLTLNAATFDRLLASNPNLKAALEENAEILRIAKFLKQATPFTALDAASARRLAARLQRLQAEAGAAIVTEGQAGDACYLLRRGRVEVAAEGRTLAALEAGAVFGEAALLTEAPRNATVRALEPCELLVMRRRDLLEAMGSGTDVGSRMVGLLRLRERPAQKPGIVAQERATADRDVIVTLKDPARPAYFRLSRQGWFLWQKLDGRRTLRELTLEFMAAFKVFAPQTVSDVLISLSEAGFLDGGRLRGDILQSLSPASWWQAALVRVRRVMEWRLSLHGLDPVLARLYRDGVHRLYTRTGQGALAAVAAAGLLVFVAGASSARAALAGHWSDPTLWFILIPAAIAGVLVHEAGHAFTVKAFGREVPSGGVGWYWFGPIAFVDTSDMWLAERGPRIAVSLAGLYSQAILAGLAALAGRLLPPASLLAAALWVFALGLYATALFNLNPLLEYDGYYALEDLLERPNLRRRSVRWLARDLPQALRAGRLDGHGAELAYGLMALAYTAAASALAGMLYRMFALEPLAQAFSFRAADALGWAVVAGVALIGLLSLAQELAD